MFQCVEHLYQRCSRFSICCGQWHQYMGGGWRWENLWFGRVHSHYSHIFSLYTTALRGGFLLWRPALSILFFKKVRTRLGSARFWVTTLPYGVPSPVLCRSSLTVTGKTSKQCPGLDFFRNAQRNDMIDNFHSVQVHHSWSLVTLCSLIMLLVVANKVPSDPSGSCVRGCGCGVTARARGHGIQIPGIASALPSFYATVAYEKLD